jgi:nucleoside 2-deoxyribosyltransferase
MKIYFAGSIRGGREDKDIYFEAINLLSKYGSVLTEHVGKSDLSAMGETSITNEEIYKRDVNWINEADIVIAEVTRPSLGVGYEIAYAELKGKKIFCLYRDIEVGKRLSAMILGNLKLNVIKYTDVKELPALFSTIFN